MTPHAAAFRIPSAWVDTMRDSVGRVPWVVSWGRGEELLAWFRPAPHGVEVQIPAGPRPLAKRLQQATVRFYVGASCGSFACILLDTASTGSVSLDQDMVVITLAPGDALTSLLTIRPDSLRLDSPLQGRDPHPVGWIRVAYDR